MSPYGIPGGLCLAPVPRDTLASGCVPDAVARPCSLRDALRHTGTWRIRRTRQVRFGRGAETVEAERDWFRLSSTATPSAETNSVRRCCDRVRSRRCADVGISGSRRLAVPSTRGAPGVVVARQPADSAPGGRSLDIVGLRTSGLLGLEAVEFPHARPPCRRTRAGTRRRSRAASRAHPTPPMSPCSIAQRTCERSLLSTPPCAISAATTIRLRSRRERTSSAGQAPPAVLIASSPNRSPKRSANHSGTSSRGIPSCDAYASRPRSKRSGIKATRRA